MPPKIKFPDGTSTMFAFAWVALYYGFHPQSEQLLDFLRQLLLRSW